MNIVKTEGKAELIEKKSRFLGMISSINDKTDVDKILDRLKHEHPKANHIVYAYRLGDDTAHMGYSDDGEPSGSAGKPLLNLILYKELKDCLLTSVRYFGGTKLGVGGLKRAYSQSAQDAIENAAIIPFIQTAELTFSADYSHVTQIKILLDKYNVELLEELYEEHASFKISIAADKKINFTNELKSINYNIIIN